ncbi:MAG: glutathione S-transferase family protein [Solirubrobacterales bacterium]|nr:glutathione S-transferase family protein [Solirubrobacterales bacterium]
MITIYRAPYSTNCERVGLALARKGLGAESIVISYEDRSAVEQVSGQGLVPVIVDEGRVISDSRAILRHLDEREPEPALYPAGVSKRAELDLFCDWFDEVWKLEPNEIEAELELPQPDMERVERLGAVVAGRLGIFERLLADRDFLWGEELSAADLVAFPFLKYARGRDPHDPDLFHRVIDEHQPLGPEHPRLSAWIERVDALPRAFGP